MRFGQVGRQWIVAKMRRMRAKIEKEESRHCSMTSASESEVREVQQRERERV